MNYTDDILVRLQNGEPVESIAASLTEDLNAANAKYAAAKEAEKAAAAKEKQAYKDKKSAISNLIEDICTLFEAWDLDQEFIDTVYNDCFEDIDDLIEVVDQTLPFLIKSLEMQKVLNDLRKPAPEAKKTAANAEVPKVDPLEDFLNTFVRK